MSYIDDDNNSASSPTTSLKNNERHFKMLSQHENYGQEKAMSIENIESKPTAKRLFRRDIDSPTKSLQFDETDYNYKDHRYVYLLVCHMPFLAKGAE